MAASYIMLADGEQASFTRDSCVHRFTEVDRDAVVLAAGTDWAGLGYASIYQVPYPKSTSISIGSDSTSHYNGSARQVYSTTGPQTITVAFEFMGNLNKYFASTAFIRTHDLLLSALVGKFFKLAVYEPQGRYESGKIAFNKWVFWYGQFDAKFSITMNADGEKIILATYRPLALESATDLGDNKGGKTYKIIPVDSIQGGDTVSSSETFEAQTPATS